MKTLFVEGNELVINNQLITEICDALSKPKLERTEWEKTLLRAFVDAANAEFLSKEIL